MKKKEGQGPDPGRLQPFNIERNSLKGIDKNILVGTVKNNKNKKITIGSKIERSDFQSLIFSPSIYSSQFSLVVSDPHHVS